MKTRKESRSDSEAHTEKGLESVGEFAELLFLRAKAQKGEIKGPFVDTLVTFATEIEEDIEKLYGAIQWHKPDIQRQLRLKDLGIKKAESLG